MKKLKNQKGETLVETLVSLLIIVLVFKPTGLFGEKSTDKV